VVTASLVPLPRLIPDSVPSFDTLIVTSSNVARRVLKEVEQRIEKSQTVRKQHEESSGNVLVTRHDYIPTERREPTERRAPTHIHIILFSLPSFLSSIMAKCCRFHAIYSVV
jgi:hypothetical protein